MLKAVTCQGSSRYLSVTASLFSVCGWLGSALPNTHICCWSTAPTAARSAIEMTLIVKHNATQRHFRQCLSPSGCLTRRPFLAIIAQPRRDVETKKFATKFVEEVPIIFGKKAIYFPRRRERDFEFVQVLKRCPRVHRSPRYKSRLRWGLEKLECESVTVMEVSCQTGRQVAATQG